MGTSIFCKSLLSSILRSRLGENDMDGTATSTKPTRSGVGFLLAAPRYLVQFLLYFGLTCLLTRLVQEPAHRPIDPSFQQAYSYFFLNATQIGKDYIFTYGPLGHFMVPRYHPDLFWLDYVVTIAIGLAIAWPVYTMLLRLKGRYWAQCALLIPFVLSAEVSAGSDIPALMSSVLMVILLRDEQVSSRWILGLTGVFWAFLALCKFTLMVLGVGFVGYLCIHFLFRRDWKRAVVLPTVFGIAVLSFWLLARQDLGNFPSFILDSLEVSKAYALGMMKDDDISMFDMVFVAIAALYVATGAALMSLQSNWKRVVVDVFFVSVMVYVLWRLGLTRKGVHEAKFFLPMMILPFFVCGSAVLTDSRAKIWKVATCIILVLGVSGYGISGKWSPKQMIKNATSRSYTTASHIFRPISHRLDLEIRWQALKYGFDLPEIRKRVGSDSIDILSYEQRLLMFHDYNYTPRYVYQGYQACTSKLLEKNGTSYWGSESHTPPEYIAYQQLQIDKRFPTMEDSQAVLAMLYCYEAVLHEEGHILYKRVADPPTRLPEPTSVAEGNLALEERFSLPDAEGGWQLLSLEFNPTFKARLKELPWLKTAFGIRVYYEDGTNTEFTLVPSMSSTPFLIPPDSSTPPDLITDLGRPLEPSLPGEKIIEAIEVFDRHEHAVTSEWEIRYTVANIPAPSHKTGWSLDPEGADDGK